MPVTTIDAVLGKLKIPIADQAVIIAEYGNLDPDTWLEELELIAMAYKVTNHRMGPPHSVHHGVRCGLRCI